MARQPAAHRLGRAQFAATRLRPWRAGCRPIRKVTCSNSAPAPAPSRRRSSNAACAKTGSWPSNRIPKLARLLRETFPRAHIITGDAWHLDELLRERCRKPIERVGAVISSLPLSEFSTRGGRGAGAKNPRRCWNRTATGCSTATTSGEPPPARRLQLPLRCLQDCLAEFPARPRECLSEVTFPAARRNAFHSVCWIIQLLNKTTASFPKLIPGLDDLGGDISPI